MRLSGKKADGKEYTSFEHKSLVRKKTASPTWQQEFQWMVQHPENSTLKILIKDKQTIGEDPVVAQGVLALASIVPEAPAKELVRPLLIQILGVLSPLGGADVAECTADHSS